MPVTANVAATKANDNQARTVMARSSVKNLHLAKLSRTIYRPFDAALYFPTTDYSKAELVRDTTGLPTLDAGRRVGLSLFPVHGIPACRKTSYRR